MFGCVACAHVPDSQRKKLDKKAVKLRLLATLSTQRDIDCLANEHRKSVFGEMSCSDFGHTEENVRNSPETVEYEPTVMMDSKPDPEPE